MADTIFNGGESTNVFFRIPHTNICCRNVIASYVVWLSATRTAKLLPHLWHRPQDIIHVPAFIAFGYYFAVMKIYALFTLHEVRPSYYLYAHTLIFCTDWLGHPYRCR